MDNPLKLNWDVMKAILRNLIGTSSHDLVFGGSEGMNCKLVSYFDSDCASDKDQWKSTFRYVFTLGGMAIIWRSRL